MGIVQFNNDYLNRGGYLPMNSPSGGGQEAPSFGDVASSVAKEIAKKKIQDEIESALASQAGAYGGLEASAPVATSIDGGTILADGSVFPGSMAPTADASISSYLPTIGSYAIPAAVTAALIHGFYGMYKGMGTEFEDKRLADLQKRGVTGFEGIKAPEKGDLNPEYEKNRDLSKLTPQEKERFAGFGELFNNDWFGKFTPEQRAALTNSAKLRESHGSYYIDNPDEVTAVARQSLPGYHDYLGNELNKDPFGGYLGYKTPEERDAIINSLLGPKV